MYCLPCPPPTLIIIDIYSFIKIPFQIIASDLSRPKVKMEVVDGWGQNNVWAIWMR